MEKHIPFRLMAIFALITLAFALFSCEDDNDGDLSGRWSFVEPPHPISRLSRPNTELNPLFDIIFSIRGGEFTEVDAVILGDFIEGETANFEGKDILFSGNGFSIRLNNVTRAANSLQVNSVEYTIDGQSKTLGALQINPY
jgi:hypothetical protein